MASRLKSLHGPTGNLILSVAFLDSLNNGQDSNNTGLRHRGRPGCSSLLGAMVEIGPFGVNPDGKSLYPRRFAWNKVANTLFLESPAGVGLPYSNSSEGTTRNRVTKGPVRHYIPELMDVILRKMRFVSKGIMYQQLRKNGSSSAFDLGKIDQYNIYAPLCNSSRSGKARRPRMAYDPCDSLVGSNWDFKHTPSTMFPIYRRLMSSRLRILLYSGDVDSVVPVTSTRYSIAAMGLRVMKPWSPWYGGDSDEVAGYRVIYDGLSFATIRGAGHMVPQSKPSRAFALLFQVSYFR
ncbi:hypothetical protein DH2020_006728 [Rehmannia glutinosa]|uniref:Serine carboxypeptidase-like protein n=1 Tax=Rehmannia glutinosa TaxID=99300 RepID=A0ABR0XK08_REHGL